MFQSSFVISRVRTLEERSGLILEELRKSGIGKRPTVWVAHSMGGLLVKKMLTDGETKLSFISPAMNTVLSLSKLHLCLNVIF